MSYLLLISAAFAAPVSAPSTEAAPDTPTAVEEPDSDEPASDEPDSDEPADEPTPIDEDSLLIQHARLWDGTGASERETDILVIDGLIDTIGVDLVPPAGVRTLDATHYAVIPGLIDAHVHVASVPGSALRGDDTETLIQNIQSGLRAYLACGVTTVLDTGIPHEYIETIRGWLDSGLPGPDVEFLGAPVSPPDGYLAVVLPELPVIGTPQALTEHLDELVALDTVGVKITMEEGFVGRPWPLQTPEMRAAITRESAARGLPIYVHAMSPAEYTASLDMGAYAIVHPLDWPKRQVIKRLREQGTYVISTVGIADMFMVPYDRARLTDPLVQLVVPQPLLETAADPAMRRAYQDQVLDLLLPDLPQVFHGLAVWQLDGRGPSRRRVRELQLSLAELHAAGVKVVLGSDTGNWPLLPYSFQGISTLRELEMWSQAGISPEDTLLAATRLAAEMIGVDDRVGTIEPGKRADLLIVAGDPLHDISAIHDATRYTVKDGVARTPQEWMSQTSPSPRPVRSISEKRETPRSSSP